MDKANHKEQNIVAMSDYMPETGYSALAQVEAYWQALRAGRLLPKRAEIDPRGIEGALENAFILERIAPGVARVRVAGTHLNDVMGMEVRGMPLTAFFAPAHRRTVADTLEELFQMPATCELRLQAPAAVGRPALEAKLILLPLLSDMGDVSRALGCLVAKGDIGTTPRRFDVTDHRFEALIRGPETHPQEVPQAPAPAMQPVAAKGFEAPKTPFVSAIDQAAADRDGTEKRPPYLRLVKSDD